MGISMPLPSSESLVALKAHDELAGAGHHKNIN
jgi:hypothetical protein